MTTSFYAPPAARRGLRIDLGADEAYHAVRVLRKGPGDEIIVVDGEGGWFRVVLEQVDQRRAAGSVVEERWDAGEAAYDLTIGMALLKNQHRFETFLEKAAELGVRTVVPLITARTEKAHVKDRRAQDILIAAMKQSGRSRLVQLTPPTAIETLLHATTGAGFICHEQADPGSSLLTQLGRNPDARQCTIVVGPEGGFTDQEVAAAEQAGFMPVSLGPRRLRAETAAMAAATACMLVWPEVPVAKVM